MKYLMMALVTACAVLESGAASCSGCGTRSGSDANYCPACGKKLPASSLEAQYEALMREALPKMGVASCAADEMIAVRSVAAVFMEGKQYSAKIVSDDVRLVKERDVTLGFMTLEVNGERTEMKTRMKKFDGKWFVVK